MRYNNELLAHGDAAIDLRKQIGRRKATFLYASKTADRNHAELLRTHLEKL
jgi:uncharacterized protein YeaO (DUF488 family)